MKNIAPKTKKRLVNVLEENRHLSTEELVDVIEKGFRVTRSEEARPPQPTPELGQTWRGRQSGRLVKVTSAPRDRWSGHVGWECIDESRGPKIGRVYAPNWTERYEFVSAAS